MATNDIYTTNTVHKYYCNPSDLHIESLKFTAYAEKTLGDANNAKLQSDVYADASTLYPLVGSTKPYHSLRRSFNRFKTEDRLPENIDQLNLNMQDPILYEKYGKSKFLKCEPHDKCYRFYDRVTTVTYMEQGEKVTSKIVSLCNYAVVTAVKGTTVHLAADGCRKLYPKVYVSYTKRFDNIQQLYTVHVILNKKFFPLAFFLLQSATKQVMTVVFGKVKQWLGPFTNVQKFTSDFETAPRNAVSKIWPGIIKTGCAIHFIRALGVWAINRGIYRDPLLIISRSLMDKAYGLCYFPAKYTVAAVNSLEKQIPTIGEGTLFGDELVSYIRKEWLAQDISVANEDVRCNNGSEVFHWVALRLDNEFKRNPYQFLNLLQRMNEKVSQQICQWNHLVQSRKQQCIENAHKEMLANLEPEIQNFSFDIAFNNFFEKTKRLTKVSSSFFHQLQLSSPVSEKFTEEEIDFEKLIIQDNTKLSKQSRSLTPTDKVTVTFVSMDSVNTFETKTVIITNVKSTFIRKSSIAFPEMPTNLYFQSKHVADMHAELLLYAGQLYITDFGSANGLKINNRLISITGSHSSPQEIRNDDIIQIGPMRIKVNLVASNRTSSKPKIPTLDNPPTKSIKLESEKGDIRHIKLVEAQPVFLGKATINDPMTSIKAMFVTSGVSYKQAKIWLSRNKIFIRPMSRTYPTKLNNKTITNVTELSTGDHLTFGFNNSFRLDLTISFDATPFTPINKPTITLMQVPNIGSPFTLKQINFDGDEIVIGRTTSTDKSSKSNGLFDCNALSDNHASLRHLNGINYIIDNASKTGTYVVCNNVLKRIKPNVATIINNEATIQFGCSDSRVNFIRTYFKAIPHCAEAPATNTFMCTFGSCKRIFTTESFLNNHMNVSHPTSESAPSPPKILKIGMAIERVSITLSRADDAGTPFLQKILNFTNHDEVIIGRSTLDNTVSKRNGYLDCTTMSKEHAILSFLNKRIYVTPLTNATYTRRSMKFIQIQPHVRTPLENGSIIQFGRATRTNPRTFIRTQIQAVIRSSSKVVATTATVSSTPTTHMCDFENCNRVFASQSFLNHHIYITHARPQLSANDKHTVVVTLLRVGTIEMPFCRKDISLKNHATISIGRSTYEQQPSNNNGFFFCSGVSRHHATITNTDGSIYITDHEDSTGTLISSDAGPITLQRNVQTILSNGKTLQFGKPSVKFNNFIRLNIQIKKQQKRQ